MLVEGEGQTGCYYRTEGANTLSVEGKQHRI